ncbi:MAG: hypothetical protein M1343_01240 [Chloroflexi bacterium]|nr:hypothetical protein [Chloroflexota bacterium]
MELVFEIGNVQAPKGHALVYFRGLNSYSTILATYLVVPPIRLDLTKYMPPMLASSVPQAEAGNVSFVAIPPVAESADSIEQLRELAETRGDDLAFAGTVDASRPDSILLAVNEAARAYADLYGKRALVSPAEDDLTVQRVLFEMMSERDRLGELGKSIGKLRYAIEGGDKASAEETIREIRILADLLPGKFKVDALIKAAQTPGDLGGKIASLYIDRCYFLLNEDYAGVPKIEEQIRALEIELADQK